MKVICDNRTQHSSYLWGGRLSENVHEKFLLWLELYDILTELRSHSRTHLSDSSMSTLKICAFLWMSAMPPFKRLIFLCSIFFFFLQNRVAETSTLSVLCLECFLGCNLSVWATCSILFPDTAVLELCRLSSQTRNSAQLMASASLYLSPTQPRRLPSTHNDCFLQHMFTEMELLNQTVGIFNFLITNKTIFFFLSPHHF